MNILLRLVAVSSLAGLAFVAPVIADDFSISPPYSTTGRYLAGQQAMTDLRTPDAASFFRDAQTSDWNNPMIVEQASVALAADGQIDTAADSARHLLELFPNDDVARLLVATQAIKQRRYDAAIQDLDKVGVDSFWSIGGSVLRAWALVGEGKVDDAFKMLDGRRAKSR